MPPAATPLLPPLLPRATPSFPFRARELFSAMFFGDESARRRCLMLRRVQEVQATAA